MAYMVTARLLLDVPCEASAADGANEILREQQREYVPGSCLVDYALDSFDPVALAADYGEGEAFEGLNLAAAAPAMLAALQAGLDALGRIDDFPKATGGDHPDIQNRALDAMAAAIALATGAPTGEAASGER